VFEGPFAEEDRLVAFCETVDDGGGGCLGSAGVWAEV